MFEHLTIDAKILQTMKTGSTKPTYSHIIHRTGTRTRSRVYTPLVIVAYRPLSFSREVRVTMFAGQLILLPSLGVYLMLLISKLLLIFVTSTCYGFESFSKKCCSYIIRRICIILTRFI